MRNSSRSPTARAEQVALELRQLPRARHRGPVDQRTAPSTRCSRWPRRRRGSSAPAPAPASRPARAAPRTAGPRASWRGPGRGCRGSRRCRCGRAARRSPACSPQMRTSSASASLVPSGASSAMRLGMPSSTSCSSASSAFCSSSAAVTTAFSSRARSTSAGRSSALAPFTDWATRLALRAGLVAALDRRVAPGEQLLQRGRRPGRSPGGPACGRRRWRDRAGRGGRASHQGIGAGRTGFTTSVPPGGGGRGPRSSEDGRQLIERGLRRVHCRPLSPRRPVVRLRHVRRPAARRHHRRQLRPHGRRPARPRGAGGRAQRAALDVRADARATSTRWRSACSPRASGRATGSASGRPTCAEWTLRAVRHREDRRRSSSTSTRPTARTSWSTC